MGSFRSVSLKTPLIDEVEQLIKELPYYNSIAEFVSESVRLRLEDRRKQLKETE